ncbi:MAG: hypothetical protein GY953_04285 [bacterium]|nr:hypothetical protein [bacterium]
MSDVRMSNSHSPFPAEISPSPITRGSATLPLDEEMLRYRDLQQPVWRVSVDECDVEFETWRRLAHFRRSCDIPNIKLGDYLR